MSNEVISWYISKGYPKRIIENSIAYGKAAADAIIEFAVKDQYLEICRDEKLFLRKPDNFLSGF